MSLLEAPLIAADDSSGLLAVTSFAALAGIKLEKTPVGKSLSGAVCAMLISSVVVSVTSTLNSQPSTLNPQPSTLNPTPYTLNPQPQTFNPEIWTMRPRRVSEEGGIWPKLKSEMQAGLKVRV